MEYCSRLDRFRDGKELRLGEHTVVMGILNVTPDSFSDGGKWNTLEQAKEHLLEMAEDGAELIDIGAESSRPGFQVMTAEEEMASLSPWIPSRLRQRRWRPGWACISSMISGACNMRRSQDAWQRLPQDTGFL